MIDTGLEAAATECLAALRERGLTVVTAESCTGGLIAAALTAIAGASDVVHGGFVTYANAAKSGMLGVDPALIARVGAVSAAVAAAMAEGAREKTGADVAIAVTGIAGPGGATPGKPVGTVWFGMSGPASTHVETVLFGGDREEVRNQTVVHALGLVHREYRKSLPPAV